MMEKDLSFTGLTGWIISSPIPGPTTAAGSPKNRKITIMLRITERTIAVNAKSATRLTARDEFSEMASQAITPRSMTERGIMIKSSMDQEYPVGIKTSSLEISL